MGPEDNKTTDDQSSHLKNLFGMRQLAISKSFALSVGRESYDDPAAVELHLAELLAIRMRQREILQSAIAKREEMDLAALREKTASKSEKFNDSSIIDFVTTAGPPPLEDHASMDKEQELLFFQEGAILCKLAESSGAIRMLTDPDAVKHMAQACGLQLSLEQLSLGDSLDNLDQGYSISPSALDGEHAFTSAGLSIELAAPILGRLLTGEKARNARERLFGVFGAAASDFHREKLADLLAQPLGLKNGPRELTRRAKVNPGERPIFSSPIQWSRLTLSELLELSKEIDVLIPQAQNGDFVSDLLTIAAPSRGLSGLIGGTIPKKNMPFFDDLRFALSAPIQKIFLEIDAIAAQDRQRRATSWFDGIAGQRSAELVAKVWGAHAAKSTTFSEIEMVAGNAHNIWKSLEGQEALGLFSVRAAAGLGLSLSGRDLPERTKAKLKSFHGFSDGAWRLLGKLNSDPHSPASNWAAHIGGSAKKAESSEVDAVAAAVAEISARIAVGYELPAGLYAPPKRDDFRAMRDGAAIVLGSALSAASAKGAGVEKTEALLAKLFTCKETFARLFALPPEPPELAGTPLADRQAETNAFYAKAPILLARMFDKALADGCDRAWPALELVNDWLSNAEWGIWRELPDNISWAEANRRQKEWHDMILRRERSGKESVAWDSLIGPSANPQTGFSATPLTDGGMLWDEGKAMHHCVSSYARTCENGGSRIFGILKDGERFATLELAQDGDGEWRSVQLKGRFNKIIDDERAIEFTGQICDAYQAAHVAKIAAATPQAPEIDNFADKLASKRNDPAIPAGRDHLPARAPE